MILRRADTSLPSDVRSHNPGPPPGALYLTEQATNSKQNNMAARKKQPLIELHRAQIAGVQFSDYQSARGLKPGITLDVTWERKNAYDRRALRLSYGGVKLGYMKKGSKEQSLAWRLHEQDLPVNVVLVAYNKTNPTWQMFTFKLQSTASPATQDELRFNEMRAAVGSRFDEKGNW